MRMRIRSLPRSVFRRLPPPSLAVKHERLRFRTADYQDDDFFGRPAAHDAERVIFFGGISESNAVRALRIV